MTDNNNNFLAIPQVITGYFRLSNREVPQKIAFDYFLSDATLLLQSDCPKRKYFLLLPPVSLTK